MKLVNYYLITGLFTIVVLSQDSTDQCSSLLEHGIYDRFTQDSLITSATQIQNDICSQYFEVDQSSESWGGSGSYKFFGLSASFSKEQLHAMGAAMCSAGASQTFDLNSYKQWSSIVSEAGLKAWTACLELTKQRGIQVTTDFQEENPTVIVIKLSYTSYVGGPNATTIQDITLSPSNAIKCNGTLWRAIGKQDAITTQELSMTCTRNLFDVPRLINGGLYLALPTTIVITTPIGTVTRTLSGYLATDKLRYIEDAREQMNDYAKKIDDAIVSMSTKLLTANDTLSVGTQLSAIRLGFPVIFSSFYVDPPHVYYRINDERGYLGEVTAWCAAENDANQWIQVSSSIPQNWVAVETRGRAEAQYTQWVSKYKVDYSNDGITWTPVDNDKVFDGNTDYDTVKHNDFATPVVARALRLRPVDWSNHICLRFDAIIKN